MNSTVSVEVHWGGQVPTLDAGAPVQRSVVSDLLTNDP